MSITKTGIQVDTDPRFSNPTEFEENGQQRQITAIGLETDTTYHVRGYIISDGNRIYSDNTKQFTTGHVDYFTIKNTSNGTNTIGITKQGSPDVTVEYSLDGGAWTSWSSSGSNLSISVPAGKSVRFRGNNATFATSSTAAVFTASASCEASGDVNTLLNKIGGDIVIQDNAFRNLFYNNTYIDTNGLVLPATTLAQSCYYSMFYGCTGLRTAPSLPATTLANDCYHNMFQGCTSLVNAPALRATTLAQECYENMFQGCTSLVNAPAISATAFALYSCSNMFRGCTSLTTVPDFYVTTLGQYCCYYMFYGCTSLTKAPALPATSAAQACYWGMFSGCTSLVNAPALPATTLAQECYREMFYGCTSLIQAPALPATTLANYCYQAMFKNCTSLNRIICYCTNWVTNNAYMWVENVAASGDFYDLGNSRAPIDNISGVPIGWTVHTTLPTTGKFTINNTDSSSNTIGLRKVRNGGSGSWYHISFDFSVDGGITWSHWDSDYGLFSVTIPVGGSVQFSGTNNLFNSYNEYYAFTSTGYCTLSGDINTLLTPNGGDVPNPTLTGLFDGMNKMDIAGLTLPSATVGIFSYCRMFLNCTSMTTAPALPATTIYSHCYEQMFSGCTSLVNAPALPATTLYDTCYSNMFYGCTSLTSTPTLPATTLAGYCYYAMFSGCTSLRTTPLLPATIMARYCYTHMFSNCTSLTQAPALNATTLAEACYESMLAGCTGLTSAPTLPATTLQPSCYQGMFAGCTCLTSAPTLSVTTLKKACYRAMFMNCTSLTTSPSLPATTLAEECYYEMFRGCTSLSSIVTYASNISANNCTSAWVYQVAASGDFYNLGIASYTSGTNGIPSGWTEHTSL